MHSPHVKSKYCFYYDNLLCEFFHRENFKFCIPVAHRPSLSISISKYTYILTLEVFFLLKQKMWRNCSMPESNWLKISEGNCHNLWDQLLLLAVKNPLLSELLVKKTFLAISETILKKETVLSEKFAMFLSSPVENYPSVFVLESVLRVRELLLQQLLAQAGNNKIQIKCLHSKTKN